MLKRKYGYSLLELLIAVTVLFIASFYLFSLYAYGCKAAKNTRTANTSVFLAQEKLEEIRPFANDLYTKSVSGEFAEPYEGYKWKAEIKPFLDTFGLLQVSVWKKNSPPCRLRVLCANPSCGSVSSHVYDSEVVYTVPQDKIAFKCNSYWENSNQTFNNPKSLGAWKTTSLVGHPGRGLVWLADGEQAKVARCVYVDNKLTNCDVFVAPNTTGGQKPYFIDIAGDIMGNYLFVADSANQGIWILDDSQAKTQWVGNKYLPCYEDPLDGISGLACDQYGENVWVCEGAKRSLRLFSGGRWLTKLEVPYSGNSLLKGIAVNPWGSAIYTFDSSCLYILIYSDLPRWQKVSLPLELIEQDPQGICCDPYNSRLYMNTAKGKPWLIVPQSDGRVFKEYFKQTGWK
ncbi:hypothetical protein IJT10_02810 [bacterium]|nr:hypothetical protein [bacterium]